MVLAWIQIRVVRDAFDIEVFQKQPNGRPLWAVPVRVGFILWVGGHHKNRNVRKRRFPVLATCK